MKLSNLLYSSKVKTEIPYILQDFLSYKNANK